MALLRHVEQYPNQWNYSGWDFYYKKSVDNEENIFIFLVTLLFMNTKASLFGSLY